MAWPTNKPESTKFDNAADSIAESRAELHTMSQAVNDIVDFVDTTGIANGSVLKYNASNGRLEVGSDDRVSNPILFGDTVTDDSAGQIQGKIEFTSAESSGGGDVVTITTTESDEFDTSLITLTSRGGTDNAINLKVSARRSGQTINDTFLFQTGQVNLDSDGFNQVGTLTRVNQLMIVGPPSANNVDYPVPTIGTGNGDLYIGTNIGSSLNNGNAARLISDSVGDPDHTDLNAECIYFDASERSIYINTVSLHDSAGSPAHDGHIYLNSQKWPNEDGSSGQVLKTNGSGVLSWSNESSAPNVFVTFQGDSGSTTANTTNDTLEIRGGTGISTSVSGDVLTITNDSPATGSGGIINITGGDNIAVSNPDSTGSFEITLSQLSAPLNCNDQQLSNMAIKNFGEIIHDLGTTGGTLTPNPNNGSVQKVTLNNNLTLNSLSSVANGDSVTLIVRQDGTGNRTLSSTMKFAGGTKTLSTGANAIDVITIFYDGTDYLASLSTNFS